MVIGLRIRLDSGCPHVIQYALRFCVQRVLRGGLQQAVVNKERGLDSLLLHILTYLQAADEIAPFRHFRYLELEASYGAQVMYTLESVVGCELPGPIAEGLSPSGFALRRGVLDGYCFSIIGKVPASHCFASERVTWTNELSRLTCQ